MKANRVRVAVILLGVVVLAAKALLAQDPLELAPNIYKKLFENEKVRVCDIRMKPGDTVATHSHPDHLLYILDPGTVQLTYQDGTSKNIEAKAGDVLWVDAETHASANIGPTEIHAIIVELKK